MWSTKYKYCQSCGTTEYIHIARGLCKKCYNKDIENRHRPNERIRGKASKELSKKKLESLYIKKQLSMSEIAKLNNCSRQYVHKKLKEFKIPARPKTVTRNLALQNHKLSYTKIKNGHEELITMQHNFLDEDFFSKWTSEMAYVLGIIATDGCVTTYTAPHSKKKYKRLSIDQKESELLEKVLSLLKSNIKIYKRRNNDNDIIHTIQITNKKVVNDVIGFGITERKSLTLKFPEMPKEYVRHFIRGCWDGDGSIFINGNKYRANYISGSINFISKMIEILISVGFNNVKLLETKKEQHSIYYFYIDGNYYCTKLYYYLYYEVPPGQYLERKNKLFLKAVRLNAIKEAHREFLKSIHK